MENRPLMLLVARNILPDQEERHNNYYEKWFFRTLIPFLNKSVGIKAVERYRSIKENPDYPKYMQVWYFNNVQELQRFEKSEEYEAVLRSMDANLPGTDFRWWAQYWIENSWQYGTLGQSLEPKDGSIIHIETSQRQSNDENYFSTEVKVGEPTQIDRCRILKENPKYPSSLYIFRFPTVEIFEAWERKRKRVDKTDDASASSIKPGWYIQYQLTRSWRK